MAIRYSRIAQQARLRLRSGGGTAGQALKMLQRLRDVCACAAMDKEWRDESGGGGGGVDDDDVDGDDGGDDDDVDGDDGGDDGGGDGDGGAKGNEEAIEDVLKVMANMKIDESNDVAAAGAAGVPDFLDSDSDGEEQSKLPLPRAAVTSSKIMYKMLARFCYSIIWIL